MASACIVPYHDGDTVKIRCSTVKRVIVGVQSVGDEDGELYNEFAIRILNMCIGPGPAYMHMYRHWSVR